MDRKKPSWIRELDNEMAAIHEGIDAFRQQIASMQSKGKGSATPAGVNLIADMLQSVSDGVTEYMQDFAGKTVASERLVQFNPDIVAAISLQSLFNLVVTHFDDDEDDGPTWQNAATNIGNALEDEARFVMFREESPGLMAHIQGRHTGPKWQLKKSLKQAMQKVKSAWQDWPIEDRRHCGVVCLELILKKTDIFALGESVRWRPKGHKKLKIITLTPKAKDYIKQRHEILEIFKPKLRPMVCEPDDWIDVYDGGYLLGELKRIKLIKDRHPDQLEGITPETAPEVYRAVNILQKVPWRINRRLLDVMKHYWQEYQDDQKLRSKLFGDLSDAQIELYISEADLFADEERFYLPVSLDWRGRVYYLPFLNPQGSDPARALLEFADPKPVDDDRWLNGYGYHLFTGDRIEDEKRGKWQYKNERQIIQSAIDPIKIRWWADADKPWMCLRWAFDVTRNTQEWKRATIPKIGDQTAEAVVPHSRLPFYVDGTANGLQHLSALLRDERGGYLTNLVPTGEPQDIYTHIAEALNKKLKAELTPTCTFAGKKPNVFFLFLRKSHNNEWAEYGVNRKTVKAPIMTTGYGSTHYRRTELINKYIIDNTERYGVNHPFDNTLKASAWLDKQIIATVKDVCRCMSALEYFESVAAAITESGKHIEWISPSGFPVRQRYFVFESKPVETALKKNQNPRKRRFRKQTDTINVISSINGLSPNLIHSIDAAMLHKVVCRCADAGINQIAVIHDSFAVPVPDVFGWYPRPGLHRILQLAFVDVHRDDLLRQYHNHFADSAKLPEMPEKGNLDISDFLASTYSFT
jgi:Autographiviridae RNA polymerase